MSLLETIEVKTGADPDAAVVWLHGLGADGHDFEPLVPRLELQESAAVRFVLPHAPIRPVTLNHGLEMRAWFDIYGLDRLLEEDEKGIRDSEAAVRALVLREIERGIHPSRIVLAGFSQGGAIALQTALRFDRSLAGVLALSTYLPLAGTLPEERHEANAALGIFMAHGTDDPVLPFDLGQRSKAKLEELGHPVEWHEYRMPHSVCPQEERDISRWLDTALRGRRT